MTKDQKKLKQLQEENAFLASHNARLGEALDAKRDDLNAQGEILAHTTKQLDYLSYTVDKLSQERHEMNVKLQELERTRQITADGLMIERDELLVRSRRLEMRIRGLGFEIV